MDRLQGQNVACQKWPIPLLLKWDTLHLKPTVTAKSASFIAARELLGYYLAFISHFLTFYHYDSHGTYNYLDTLLLWRLFDPLLVITSSSIHHKKRLPSPGSESFIAVPLVELLVVFEWDRKDGSICCLENFFLNSYQFFPPATQLLWSLA